MTTSSREILINERKTIHPITRTKEYVKNLNVPPFEISTLISMYVDHPSQKDVANRYNHIHLALISPEFQYSWPSKTNDTRLAKILPTKVIRHN
jgi:hypothetical protein